jgi:molybdopterin-guanine dinucleotide biosynthesis protein B
MHEDVRAVKTFGVAGWSGSGKTTLIEKLIPRFVDRGLRVSLIKHAHHYFDIDKPGKDSYRHREAGASEVMLVSDLRWALLSELRGASEPTLEECIERISPCDLLLVEGFKREAIPKLETWRKANQKPLLHPEDPGIIALAADAPVDSGLRRFDLDDAEGIADFILKHLRIQ